MDLMVVGISHHTAPVELREKLSFNLNQLEPILSEERKNHSSLETAVLSTCNRTEVYGVNSEWFEDWAMGFLSRHYEKTDLRKFLYTKSNAAMVEHLFKVASGLDSMVLGENEILKQVKEAYLLSQKLGLTGKISNVLFQRALYVGKLVRTHTAISQGTVSVGNVAVSLAEKIFGNLSNSTVLIFGAGKMAEISAQYLLGKKVNKLLVANRTLENARALAEKFNAQALSLEEGFKNILNADIIITSLSAKEPLLTHALVAQSMEKRLNRSLFIIDISVPRNVAPEVHGIDNVYLYNIDDMEGIVRENIHKRSCEIKKAAQIVNSKAKEFYDWYCSLKSGEEKSLKHQTGDRE